MFGFRINIPYLSVIIFFVVVIHMYSSYICVQQQPFTLRKVLAKINVKSWYREFMEKLIENQLKQKTVLKQKNDGVEDEVLKHVGEPEAAKKIGVLENKRNIDYSIYSDVLSMQKPKYKTNYKNPCWELTVDNGTRVRCLPYFHLVGVDKCGTTDLWKRMVQHPQILPNAGNVGKSTMWWSWRRFGFDVWSKGRTPWTFEKYMNQFDAAARKIESFAVKTRNNEDDYHPLITGDGSPTVFWDFTGWNLMPQNKDKTADNALLTPHALHHLLPKSYFLLIFRNPTERLYSDYLYWDRKADKKSAEIFHHGVIRSIKLFEDCKKINTLKSCLYDKELHMNMPVRILVGMYVVYLKEWFKVFEKDRFLIIKNEEYSKDIKTHVQRIFQYLGLDTLSDEGMGKIAKQSRKNDQSMKKKAIGPMWQETRQILDDLYGSYNEELAEFLADNKYLWKDDP